MSQHSDYELIDSGFCQKLERFGHYTIARPSPQAVWKPLLSQTVWDKAHASFERCQGERWKIQTKMPKEWNIQIDNIQFLIRPTEFGHLGIFVEQRPLWAKIQEEIQQAKTKNPSKPVRALNLFAYSGGSTLAAAHAGAEVCHLDAAKGMIEWARKNASLNMLQDAPIRWIVDDAIVFLTREVKRKKQYDAIILDPPSFGRGVNGEVFKIEENILELLTLCNKLLSDAPLFILLSCHTAGFTEKTLTYLLQDCFPRAQSSINTGELALPSTTGRVIPNGVWAMLHFQK